MSNLNQEEIRNLYNLYLMGKGDDYNNSYENTYNISGDNLNFNQLFKYIFENTYLEAHSFCFNAYSGMGKSFTIRRLLKRAIDNNYQVLFINFSDDCTIDFESYNELNIVNNIFKILNKNYSFKDMKNYGHGENVYLILDNVNKLTILNIERLKKIIEKLNAIGITVVLDYDIEISNSSLISIDSIYNDDTDDNVLKEILSINILYILHSKIDQFRTGNNINLFKNYKGKGQLLWNYYQSIVKQVDNSEVYGYVCDYLVPYLGYMLCFHTDLKNEDDEIIEIKKELFNNICEVIVDNYPSNFDSDQLFEELKKVPIISIKNDKISFSHEYFSNFASAVHFLNNDLIYLNKGTNPLLKREQRTTDDNYIVTELYVDLYNRGVEDNNRDFLIKRLRDNIKDNNDRSMKGRFRNIINDIVYYPIYNRTACFDYIDNLPDILSDDDTAYGDDDFGQWSKAFCLEKMAKLYYENFDKDYSTAELYLLKAHEILIGILNKNTNCNKQFNEIVESNIDEILEYDSNLVDEKRVYHVLGKIYSNYEKITRVSSAYKIYEVASVGCHFSCNILADYYERIHDYNSAEQYYMKSIKMGDIWANKPLINLYLKSDFNEYYEPYKSLEERYKLVKERLGNISYSNVSNIFITIYKADILKKLMIFII